MQPVIQYVSFNFSTSVSLFLMFFYSTIESPQPQPPLTSPLTAGLPCINAVPENWLPDKIMFCLMFGCCSVTKAKGVGC